MLYLRLAESCSMADSADLSCPIEFPRFVIFSVGAKEIEDPSLLAWFSIIFFPPANGILSKGWVIIQTLLTGFTFALNNHFSHFQFGSNSGMLQRKKKNQNSFLSHWIIHQQLPVAERVKKKHIRKGIDSISSLLLVISQHVQILNVYEMKVRSSRKDVFKVIALCWTPVTPTGK